MFKEAPDKDVEGLPIFYVFVSLYINVSVLQHWVWMGAEFMYLH